MAASAQVSVSSAFDGGNGTLVKQLKSPDDPNVWEVHIRIQPDVYTELEDIQHMQYFCFRVMVTGINNNSNTTGGGPQRIKYVLINAKDVSYPEAWAGTSVMYSDQDGLGEHGADGWKRNVDTFYTQGQLWWEHLHTANGSLYFSYFVPFTYQRHLRLIHQCEQKSISDGASCQVQTLGQTLEGREIEYITTGTGSSTCWIIHRQHPGESMAEHYAEGLLTRLLGLDSNNNRDGNQEDDDDDQVVAQIKQRYTFYIVPCMCLDGAVRGHLRTNSVGANLNREWTTKGDYEAPTMHRSPEVYYVLHKMQQTGVDCFLDIHGDEELPFNFLMPPQNIPNWGPRLQALHGAFLGAYVRANSDMQKPVGYPPMETVEEVLQYMNVAVNQIAQRFDCFGAVLEMPFKDCLSNPDPAFGWTPARARKLGASVLEPLLYIHPYLRAEGEFWTDFPADDAFVETSDEYEHDKTTDEEFQPLQKRIYSDVHQGHPHGRMVAAAEESSS